MRDLATLKTTGQQRLAVLVADIGEVLAGHTDARRPGALQTINEVPLLFRHRHLIVVRTNVLVLVRVVGSIGKLEESTSGGALGDLTHPLSGLDHPFMLMAAGTAASFISSQVL